MLKKVVIVDYEKSVRPKNLFSLTGQNVLFARKIPWRNCNVQRPSREKDMNVISYMGHWLKTF